MDDRPDNLPTRSMDEIRAEFAKITRAQPAPADVVERVAKALARADCISVEDDWALFINKAKAAIEAMGVSDEVERLREALNAIIDRAPERDPKWAGMNARDIARQALAHKEGNENG